MERLPGKVGQGTERAEGHARSSGMCPKEFVHRPGGSHTVSLASGTMEASGTEWMKPDRKSVV